MSAAPVFAPVISMPDDEYLRHPTESMNSTDSPAANVHLYASTWVVPSVWNTVTSVAVEAWSLRISKVWRFRCVDAPGEDTTVVVVAVVIVVFSRPGVIVPALLST